MMKMSTSVVFLMFLGVCVAQDHFWYPSQDGKDRLLPLRSSEFSDTIQNTPVAVVLYSLPQTDDPLQAHMYSINNNMIQLAAQFLELKGVKFFKVNMVENMDLVKQEGVSAAGAVHVYVNGRKIVYNGYRSAESLMAFIQRAESPIVESLNVKQDKKVFDKVENSKLVGYFNPASPQLAAFEAAAKVHHPSVSFYTVADPLMAKHMKLSVPGSIQIRRPYEKQAELLPQNPATEEDIHNFLAARSKPLLQKLSFHDLHSVWHSGEGAPAYVIAFVQPKSPLGGPFYKTLKKLARYSSPGDQTITLIEPDMFPFLNSHWERTFNINLQEPSLGLVNVTDNNSSWFDVSQLSQLTTDVEKIASLQLWLEDIFSGVVRVDGLPPATAQQGENVESASSEQQPNEGTEQEGQGQENAQAEDQAEGEVQSEGQ